MTTLTANKVARRASTPKASARDGGSLTGTGAMIRLALRRDRLLLPVWILVFTVLAASSAAATAGLYPTRAARVAAAEAANATPALVAMYGKIYDLANLGGIGMLKLTVLGAVLVAVLTAILTVRHTRAEEESGRLELMRAGVLGRSAPLAATLIVMMGASVVLGGLSALGLIAGGLGMTSSLAFGLAWACAGVCFTGVAAVTAQITENARTATGLAMAVLGVSFFLRAIGDTADGWAYVSWLSPIGWSQQIRPFGGDRWWVAIIPILFTVVAVSVALALNRHRDLGAGLVRPRPGPDRGAARLRSPRALAWRLQRGQLFAWMAAFALLGLVLGSMSAGVGSLIDTPAAKVMITQLGGVNELTSAFLGAELGFVGIFVSVYGIQAALRMRTEETAFRVEPLLGTSVTRIGWFLSHLLIALAGSATLMLIVGVTAGLSRGAAVGDVGGTLATMLGASLVRLPAVWLLTGLAVALFGLLPRLVLAAWAALVASAILSEFGSMMGLPDWVRDVSPFSHVPNLPGGTMEWTPTIILTVVAAALVLVGVAGFRRRDIG